MYVWQYSHPPSPRYLHNMHNNTIRDRFVMQCFNLHTFFFSIMSLQADLHHDIEGMLQQKQMM